jgi:flavin reductase (DIM6/NTAB) family NADH-FMN oxidoreductase RutF
MGDVPYLTGSTGAPIIVGALAWVECEIAERIPGGDHTIFIGRVVDLAVARPDAGPLLFYSGRYRHLAEEA